MAENYTRKRAIKLWSIAHLLIPKTRREYLYFCFNYLKWIDDFVDDPINNKDKKIDFVEDQLKLISALSNGERIKLKSNEEYFLFYCIEYANLIKNYDLISELKNSLESIRMDTERLYNNGVFSREELEEYLYKVVHPVFNLTYYFLLPSAKIQKSGKYIGRFVWKVLILRDFFEDLDSGYINISREEIEEYNLNVNNLMTDKNRIKWMKYKYPEYMTILDDDILIFKSMPLKIKLFWCPLYPFMIYELTRIKTYDYNFGVHYKKDLKKELKVFFVSFHLSLNFFLRTFF